MSDQEILTTDSTITKEVVRPLPVLKDSIICCKISSIACGLSLLIGICVLVWLTPVVLYFQICTFPSSHSFSFLDVIIVTLLWIWPILFVLCVCISIGAGMCLPPFCSELFYYLKHRDLYSNYTRNESDHEKSPDLIPLEE